MSSLREWRARFESSLPQTVVGVGLTAFSRIVPSLLVPRYRIISLRASKDLALLSEQASIWSLEEQLDLSIPLTRSGDLLQHALVRDQLAKVRPPLALLPYRSTHVAELLSREAQWSIYAAPAALRKQLEMKGAFPSILARAGIPAPLSDVVILRSLTTESLASLRQRLGSQLVLQAADRAGGGGVTTTFLHDGADIPRVLHELEKMAHGTTREFRVKVTAFVEGESASILGCVTAFGTVAGPLATQIIDQPGLISPLRGRGAFCGHDWCRSAHYGDTVHAMARQMVVAVGEVLRQDGFLGVFGLDLLVDVSQQSVVPIECNARFTGAFPMVSLLQIAEGIAPLDAIHIATFAGVPLPELERSAAELARPVRGGHLVLSNTSPGPVTVAGDLPCGVYCLRGGELEFIRPGWSYAHIQQVGEFVLTGGIPAVGTHLASGDELSRIGHLLTRDPLIGEDGMLLEWAQVAVHAAESALRLTPTIPSVPGSSTR